MELDGQQLCLSQQTRNLRVLMVDLWLGIGLSGAWRNLREWNVRKADAKMKTDTDSANFTFQWFWTKKRDSGEQIVQEWVITKGWSKTRPLWVSQLKHSSLRKMRLGSYNRTEEFRPLRLKLVIPNPGLCQVMGNSEIFQAWNRSLDASGVWKQVLLIHPWFGSCSHSACVLNGHCVSVCA